MCKYTIPMGDFKTHLSVTAVISRQKISMDTKDLNNIINKIDLINLSKTLHPTTTEFMFLFKHKYTIYQN